MDLTLNMVIWDHGKSSNLQLAILTKGLLNVHATLGKPFHCTLIVFILESSGAQHLTNQGYIQIDMHIV